ncbi:MAG: putative acetyltransferase [Chlamydiales bacterium]|jgi:putative acetyltransferase
MIRPFIPADEDDLVRVWLASTIPGQAFLPEKHWRDQEGLVREHFVPVAETWVVEVDGQFVAFASLLGDMIGGLFTHPDHQGDGHGRALVKHAHSLHDPLRVEVFRVNARALAFYERCGFAEESAHTDEGTDLEAVIMVMTSGT